MVGLSNIHETVSKMIAFVLKTNDDVNSHVLIACTKIIPSSNSLIRKYRKTILRAYIHPYIYLICIYIYILAYKNSPRSLLIIFFLFFSFFCSWLVPRESDYEGNRVPDIEWLVTTDVQVEKDHPWLRYVTA